MLPLFVRIFPALLILQLSVPAIGRGQVKPQHYGVSWSATDSMGVRQEAGTAMDSLLKMQSSKKASIVYNVRRAHPSQNRTADFYLLIGLAIILGLIRYGDPRYYALLIGAFRGAGSGRQWREMLQAAALANLGMNIFFCAVAGAYVYYLTESSTMRATGFSRPMVLLVLILAMMVIYCGKYAVIRFSGWAFRVDSLASEYLFNVFLVNKIIGIVLLPFVVIIAFSGPQWLQPMAVLSGVIVLGLLATRYLRSWSAFYTFFKGSKFHFFTYLCASEIMPIAVLVKWLLHQLR